MDALRRAASKSGAGSRSTGPGRPSLFCRRRVFAAICAVRYLDTARQRFSFRASWQPRGQTGSKTVFTLNQDLGATVALHFRKQENVGRPHKLANS
jgi:hypothetical protein